VQFLVLGPIQVRIGEKQAPITRRRHKALLAILLLHANEVVPRQRLVEELWEDGPPATADSALHGLVSQLRRLLETPDSATPIVTRPSGYALEVDPRTIDVHQFEQLVREGEVAAATGDHEDAARAFRSALTLWRGNPFEDIGDPSFVQVERRRLEEQRLHALESRIEADLQLGRAEELVAELQVLVAAEPYRERSRRQLMLALYRSGRQADALGEYRNARRLFADELGIEPGPELQALERQILRQDTALETPPTAAAPTGSGAGIRRRWYVAAVLVAAVAAAATVAALLLTRQPARARPPGLAPANSLAVIDPATNRLVGAIRVGATPIAVAVGEGSVWVANSEDGTLSRIDPKTRQVIRTIGLGTPLADVAVGFGSVWAADGAAGSLTRVDPRTNAPVQTFHQREEEPLVSPVAVSVVTADRSVWLASGTKRVLRLDPSTGRTIASIAVPVGPLALGAGQDAVWVGSLVHRVARIEPATNRVANAVSVAAETEGIAVGHGAVWAAVCCDSVWRIDPTTDVLTGTVRVGDVPSGVAVGDGSVWVASYGDGTVSRINPYTGRVVAKIRVGHGAVDVAVGYGAVWVAVERRDVS
jgi:YVTN family beta-propeller protein